MIEFLLLSVLVLALIACSELAPTPDVEIVKVTPLMAGVYSTTTEALIDTIAFRSNNRIDAIIT